MKFNKLKNMKRFLLIFALLLGAVCSWGQTVADQEKVLQKCLGIDQIAMHYDLDVAGIPRSLFAINNSAELGQGLQVNYCGRLLAFINQETLQQTKPDAYFTINDLVIPGNSAEVNLIYRYNCNKQMQQITLRVLLQKSNEQWIITEINK